MQKADLQVENDAAHKDLHIWEKPTVSATYATTRRLRDEDVPMAPVPKKVQNKLNAQKAIAEEEIPDEFFLTSIATQPCVGVVQALRSVERLADDELELADLPPRKAILDGKSRTRQEKDIRSYVQQKRDVFLVEMALDVKRKEIVRLEEKARLTEEALAKSEEQLRKDDQQFKEYLNERIAEAKKEKAEAEADAKRKQERVQMVKKVREQIASVQSEIGKLQETREECSRYKTFLNRLTPNDWKEQQKGLKLQRKRLRREQWIAREVAPLLGRITEEEETMERNSSEEADAFERLRRRGKVRRQDEEERQQRQRDRQARRKKLQQQREQEQRRAASEYVEVSSEEEYELYFKHPRQLVDIFVELEEKNLFLIQSAHETEHLRDEMEAHLQHTKADMGTKVEQLGDQIKSLKAKIKEESKRRDDLKRSCNEKASTRDQDRKLVDLAKKVTDVYLRCGLSMDHQPDTLLMLCAIESKLEELISGLDDVHYKDAGLVADLENRKERERRERVKIAKQKETKEKQDERYQTSLKRSEAPVYKKSGKQLMFKMPPCRQQRKVAKDVSDDTANVHEHKVFGVYFDKTQELQTEAPVVEEPQGPRSGAATAVLSSTMSGSLLDGSATSGTS